MHMVEYNLVYMTFLDTNWKKKHQCVWIQTGNVIDVWDSHRKI